MPATIDGSLKAVNHNRDCPGYLPRVCFVMDFAYYKSDGVYWVSLDVMGWVSDSTGQWNLGARAW